MYFKRIEVLRVDHDLTQQNIADLLNCQREVDRRYEKGTRSIPIDFLSKLAEYYQVSVDYIIGRTDVKTMYPKSSNKWWLFLLCDKKYA